MKKPMQNMQKERLENYEEDWLRPFSLYLFL
jgi:hypothetical protein